MSEQRHFGGKTWKPSSFYNEFHREYRSGGNKSSNVKCSANFSGEKKESTLKHFGVSIF